MQVVHRLVGYDRKTDRVKIRFEVPDNLLADAKRIAHVPTDDPEAAWSYPLTGDQARNLADLLGISLGSNRAAFFLEAFAVA